MNKIPSDILYNIFEYIDDELKNYWKTYFSNNVIVTLDPKSYFSHNVIPELDKGWKFITIYSGPCQDCYNAGHNINNLECLHCYNNVPCINCYWYNQDPFETHGGCNCVGIKKWVSWQELCEFYPSYKIKYPRYYDLLNSKEWLDYLEQEYQMSL